MFNNLMYFSNLITKYNLLIVLVISVKSTISSGVKAKELFDFIQSLVSSIAWPVTTVIIALILGKPIRGAISRMSKFKYGDAEASFEREL